MPKRFPPPKPANDPVDTANPYPAGGSSDDPWPEIRVLAGDGLEDELADLLGREGFGGRPVAKLLIAATIAMDRYAPLSERLEDHKRAAEAATRRKGAASRYVPTSLDEVTDQAEIIDQATRDWGRSLHAAGEAERAQGHVHYLRQQFPELFGLEPECVPNRDGEMTPRIFGNTPPELTIWFAARRLNPQEYGTWRSVGAEAPERPKRKIVSVPTFRR